MKPKPTNPLVNALLTDKYQLTMAYGYLKNGIHEEEAVFNLFFRKCPLKLEFAFFAGLDEAKRFVVSFGFTESDIEYLKQEMPIECEPEFFDWLLALDASKIQIKAIPEGNIVFPQEPLMEVKGPLAVAQLLETTLIDLTGFPSLSATSAAKFRLAVGPDIRLIEYGLRRSQGPDGGLTASRSSYLGGFDGTSNVLAGKLYGVPIFGTMAHSYITAFSGVKAKKRPILLNKKTGKTQNFRRVVLRYRNRLGFQNMNQSELDAFISYACAFPNHFLALVDTYSTLRSGVPNYIAVALALLNFGYQPLGIRLDSGDLALLSKEARVLFEKTAAVYLKFKEGLLKSQIFVSNDINHNSIEALWEAGHAINAFGIGTHQATCKDQPALGMVYKLVQIGGKPCLKVSEDDDKINLPGEKIVYRLWGKEGPIADLIALADEPEPEIGQGIKVHLKEGVLTVWPTMVMKTNPVQIPENPFTDKAGLPEFRERVLNWLKEFPEKHLRLKNPERYPVGVSLKLKRLQAKLIAISNR